MIEHESVPKKVARAVDIEKGELEENGGRATTQEAAAATWQERKRFKVTRGLRWGWGCPHQT